MSACASLGALHLLPLDLFDSPRFRRNQRVGSINHNMTWLIRGRLCACGLRCVRVVRGGAPHRRRGRRRRRRGEITTEGATSIGSAAKKWMVAINRKEELGGISPESAVRAGSAGGRGAARFARKHVVRRPGPPFFR